MGQKKLDNFRDWYNNHRVHAALGAMTPNEATQPDQTAPPIPIRQRDSSDVDIHVARRSCRGDPYLPIIDIHVQLHQAA